MVKIRNEALVCPGAVDANFEVIVNAPFHDPGFLSHLGYGGLSKRIFKKSFLTRGRIAYYTK
jgi:hypothetical protein